MADFVSKKKRSKIMRGIRQKNTKPEMIVRKALHKSGYRFRLHRKDLPGTPDIVLPKFHCVIMVHGCFWHQHNNCPAGRIPQSNRNYWAEKLLRNVQRDRKNRQLLEQLGWVVHIIWECETSDTTTLTHRLRAMLKD